MKTTFLCRDGLVARYLAHELVANERIDAIVVEEGRAARRRKLRREWRRTPWWKAPLFVLDLLALAVYGRLWSRTLARRLGDHPARRGYPTGVARFRVDDANDEECVSVLRELGPDVLVVLGTSILRAPVLEIPRRAALNIHGGIVPEYRNVHSEVWAVLKGDERNVGTTIIHLDEGVDSGAVALQDRVEQAHGFFDLRWRNVQLSARLIVEALDRLEAGALPREPQREADSGFYPTPGLGELSKLLFTRVRL